MAQFRFVSTVLFVLLLVAFWEIQVVNSDFYRNQARQNHIKTIPIPAARRQHHGPGRPSSGPEPGCSFGDDRPLAHLAREAAEDCARTRARPRIPRDAARRRLPVQQVETLLPQGEPLVRRPSVPARAPERVPGDRPDHGHASAVPGNRGLGAHDRVRRRGEQARAQPARVPAARLRCRDRQERGGAPVRPLAGRGEREPRVPRRQVSDASCGRSVESNRFPATTSP